MSSKGLKKNVDDQFSFFYLIFSAASIGLFMLILWIASMFFINDLGYYILLFYTGMILNLLIPLFYGVHKLGFKSFFSLFFTMYCGWSLGLFVLVFLMHPFYNNILFSEFIFLIPLFFFIGYLITFFTALHYAKNKYVQVIFPVIGGFGMVIGLIVVVISQAFIHTTLLGQALVNSVEVWEKAFGVNYTAFPLKVTLILLISTIINTFYFGYFYNREDLDFSLESKK